MGSRSEPHLPVMRDEAVSALVSDTSGIYLDATFGAGGHSRAILDTLSSSGRLIAADADPLAEREAARIEDPRLSFVRSNFAELDSVLDRCGAGEVDGVLMDLGMSSAQVDDPERGFSFSHPGPLDMRMDTSAGATLADRLRRVNRRELARVLRDFGEERHARAIATRIVERRERGELRTTADVAAACGGARGRRHAATRVFQALRIWVNAELDSLARGLAKAAEALRRGGRLVVISFHSLEDRIVKRFITPPAGGEGPLRREGRARRPSAGEVAANRRARSAIMRVAAKA